MSGMTGNPETPGSIFVAPGNWQERLSGRLSKTPSSHGSTHLSLRIQKKIVHFDQIIAGFRQRRWS
ncbi:hypothetical protein [Methanoregula sp.]|uniref:hypothetical protein n=1 Tax=Methanoregula sp. TaxID=2052170 RepID=UPI002372EE21|nr:hypothetical protein [Methanoregula sp.]MDD1687846.1 hypothetical protein [Methanoregula sp.]